jgi:hypothetical protein
MPQIKLDITAENHAEGSISGLIKSIGLAELAVKAVEGAFEYFKKAIEESTAAGNEAQKVNHQLEVVFGEYSETLIKNSEILKNKYNIDDDLIKQSYNYASSIGVQQTAIEGVTEKAIGLSRTFGLDLNTSIKAITLAQNGHVEALGRLIPQLRGVKDETTAMNIINEKSTLGLKLLDDETTTFEGAQKRAKINYDDMLKAIAPYVQMVSKDFVVAQGEANKTIGEFLANKENMASFGATFQVLSLSIGKLFDSFKGTATKEFDKISSSLKSMFDESKGGISAFTALSAVVQGLSLAFSISAQFTGAVIQGLIDLGTVAISSGKVVGSLYDVLFNHADPKTVLDAISKVGDSLTNFQKHTTENASDIIKTAVEGFKDFPSNTKKTSDDLKNIWDNYYKEQLNAKKKYNEEGTKLDTDNGTILSDQENKRREKDLKELEDSFKSKFQIERDNIKAKADLYTQDGLDEIKIREYVKNETAKVDKEEADSKIKETGNASMKISEIWTGTANSTVNAVGAITNGLSSAMDNISSTSEKLFEKIKSGASASIGDVAGLVSSVTSSVASGIEGIISLVAGIQQENADAEIKNLQENLDTKVTAIQDYYSQLEEEMGIAQETETEKNNKSIADLQEQLGTETSEKKKTKIKEQITELENANKRIEIEKKMNADITAAKKKEAEDEKKIKSEQWEQNRQTQIANIWIAAASGVVGALASGMSWPSVSMVAGIALAGVMSAVILATAGIQTGVIMGQKNPYAEQGGVLTGTSYSGDRIPVNMNSGEAVLRDETYQNLVKKINNNENSINGSTSIIIQNFNNYANNASELIASLKQIAIMEGAR